MKKLGVEFVVGVFMLAGFLAFVYLSLYLGEFSFFALQKNYTLVAEFTSVSGLKEGAQVEIAGVAVGRVTEISLSENDQARVVLLLGNEVAVTEDAIASVRTQGIIGDKYIKLLQGGSSEMLKPGDYITETESTVDLEEIISKYIFGDVS